MWLRQSDLRKGPLLEKLLLMLTLTFQGIQCELTISTGDLLVNTLAGTRNTLQVAISGASNPLQVTWYRNITPLITWTLGSTEPPFIPLQHRDVLQLEPDGSLSFVNVTVAYSDNYTITVIKPDLLPKTKIFTFKVYEHIEGVTLTAEAEYPKEGQDTFTLRYSLLKGVVDQTKWYFNAAQIQANQHYSLEQRKLVIRQPRREDTGQYKLVLTNPFRNVSTHKNISVIYGPDEPTLETSPDKQFYLSGDSIILSCQTDSFPLPTITWLLDAQNISNAHNSEVLSLTNVQTSQGGVYTCRVSNKKTDQQKEASKILRIYESPLGTPVCSVQAVGDSDLQYHCHWSGGSPEALLSFPALTNASSMPGHLSLTVTASHNLNGKPIICNAHHPVQQQECNVTASGPIAFLPDVTTTINSDGKVVVTIQCLSEALPMATVSWYKESEAITPGTEYDLSDDTTQLSIQDFNVSSFLLKRYTCNCTNPLGFQIKDTYLLGPSISNSSLFPNQDGTVITMTWEVPPSSVVTGFDIQMKGPDLFQDIKNGSRSKGATKGFYSIQKHPGSVRSADILFLDPKSTYRFRIIPNAGKVIGKPSESHRIGPGEGLSGPAIAGIAAGIPCSLLFLGLVIGLIYLIVVYCRKTNRQTRYPVSRAVEKAVVTHPEITPHNLLNGGLKPPPDYNRLHQAPSESSVALPTFVPPPPVRTATTV